MVVVRPSAINRGQRPRARPDPRRNADQEVPGAIHGPDRCRTIPGPFARASPRYRSRGARPAQRRRPGRLRGRHRARRPARRHRRAQARRPLPARTRHGRDRRGRHQGQQRRGHQARRHHIARDRRRRTARARRPRPASRAVPCGPAERRGRRAHGRDRRRRDRDRVDRGRGLPGRCADGGREGCPGGAGRRSGVDPLARGRVRRSRLPLRARVLHGCRHVLRQLPSRIGHRGQRPSYSRAQGRPGHRRQVRRSRGRRAAERHRS